MNIEEVKKMEFMLPMKIVITKTDEKIFIDGRNNEKISGETILIKLKEKSFIPKHGIFHVYDKEYIAI